jgi:hypothetical protein
MPETQIPTFAAADCRILVTHNRLHFLRLHQNRTADHAGIVLCTFDADFCRQAQRIDDAVRADPDMSNKLVRVNRPS